MKGKVYKSCVRSAMMYGSESWCLREKKMAILRRTDRAIVVVAHIYPPVTGQRQTLTYWTIRTLFITTTTL